MNLQSRLAFHRFTERDQCQILFMAAIFKNNCYTFKNVCEIEVLECYKNNIFKFKTKFYGGNNAINVEPEQEQTLN